MHEQISECAEGRSARSWMREEMYELGRDEFTTEADPRFPDDMDYMDGWAESRDLRDMAR